jgi:hypothetical protein
MRGISSKARPYVLKRDRDDELRKLAIELASGSGKTISEEFEQLKTEVSTWWLRPIKTTASSNITAGYLSSRKADTESGMDVWSGDKLLEVDAEQFVSVVEKVENYCVSEDNQKFHKDGFRDFADEVTLRVVFEDLPQDAAIELTQAATSGSRLSGVEKTNLGSKSISNSGGNKK